MATGGAVGPHAQWGTSTQADGAQWETEAQWHTVGLLGACWGHAGTRGTQARRHLTWGGGTLGHPEAPSGPTGHTHKPTGGHRPHTHSHRAHTGTETRSHRDTEHRGHRDTSAEGHRGREPQRHRDTKRHRDTETGTDSGKVGGGSTSCAMPTWVTVSDL